MNKFKLRAECRADVEDLKNILGDRARLKTEVDSYGDAETVITTEMNLEEFRNCVRKVEDGHVMLQTVQPENFYTGERDYAIE